MIPLSKRLVLVVCMALVLCSVPVLYHFVAAPMAVSCNDPKQLVEEKFLPSIDEFHIVPFRKQLMIDGSAGTLDLPGPWNQKPRYRIARTYNVDGYYFLPLDNFTNMFPEDETSVEAIVQAGTELPVHVRLDESERESVLTTHLYLMGGKPIHNPFSGSLTLWFDQLRNGKQPLTMILLNGRTAFEHMESQRSIMLDWMRKAWSRYDEVCNS